MTTCNNKRDSATLNQSTPVASGPADNADELKDKWSRASRDEQMTTLDPDRADDCTALAEYYDGLNQQEQAAQMALKAVQIDPLKWYRWLKLGWMYTKNGQRRKANRARCLARKMKQLTLRSGCPARMSELCREFGVDYLKALRDRNKRKRSAKKSP